MVVVVNKSHWKVKGAKEFSLNAIRTIISIDISYLTFAFCLLTDYSEKSFDNDSRQIIDLFFSFIISNLDFWSEAKLSEDFSSIQNGFRNEHKFKKTVVQQPHDG